MTCLFVCFVFYLLICDKIAAQTTHINANISSISNLMAIKKYKKNGSALARGRMCKKSTTAPASHKQKKTTKRHQMKTMNIALILNSITAHSRAVGPLFDQPISASFAVVARVE